MVNKKEYEDFLLNAINARAKSVEYGDKHGTHIITERYEVFGNSLVLSQSFSYQSIAGISYLEDKENLFKDIIDSIPLSDKLVWRSTPEISIEDDKIHVYMRLILLKWMVERRRASQINISEEMNCWCQVDSGKYKRHESGMSVMLAK